MRSAILYVCSVVRLMKNAISFDIEDWFQVENLRSVVRREDWDKFELRVERNTRIILRLLAEHQTHATFFVLGWIAERCPSLVKEIDGEGHEIASHGYSHKLIYEMSPDEFREDISRSKEILEKLIGKRIIGYRAPSFTIVKDTLWAVDILKECGFEYDSSIFPISFHDRYGFNGVSAESFFFENGLMEIPLSTIQIGKWRLPLGGGGYFRIFPYQYFHLGFKRLNRAKKGVVFYLHPWEIDGDQPQMFPARLLRIRHYTNLTKTEERLNRLLKNFSFWPINQAINSNGHP